jgi:hypothetical protein
VQPFDIDNEYRKLTQMEKDCHSAARLQAKTCLELLAGRVFEENKVELDRNIFEIASDRARTGAPLDDEKEQTAGMCDDRIVCAPLRNV